MASEFNTATEQFPHDLAQNPKNIAKVIPKDNPLFEVEKETPAKPSDYESMKFSTQVYISSYNRDLVAL